MPLGKLHNLAFRQTATGATVVSFQIVDEKGASKTLEAAEKMIPWHVYDGFPERPMFRAGTKWAINEQEDLQMQTRILEGGDGTWSIECLYEPKHEATATESSVLKRIPAILLEQDVITPSEARDFAAKIPATGQTTAWVAGK